MGLLTQEVFAGLNRNWKPVDLLSVADEQTSPAAPGYQTSTPVAGFTKYIALLFVCEVQGATGGVLDIVIENAHAATGADWYEYAHLTQLAAGGAASCITFAPAFNKALGAVGKNQTTAMVLAAGTVGAGAWLDAFRVRMVAGANTTAGKVQSVKVYGLLAA